MKVVFVRHGESEANVAGVVNDDPADPVHLTARGRAQAEACALALRGAALAHAFVSEFPRAQETAAILLRGHDCALSVDSRLNERHSGMNGLPVEAFHDLVRSDPIGTKPQHGESFLEQMERLRAFLDDVAARHPRAVVLAVSHENPIVAALALEAGDPVASIERAVANCERVEVAWPQPDPGPNRVCWRRPFAA